MHVHGLSLLGMKDTRFMRLRFLGLFYTVRSVNFLLACYCALLTCKARSKVKPVWNKSMFMQTE